MTIEMIEDSMNLSKIQGKLLKLLIEDLEEKVFHGKDILYK